MSAITDFLNSDGLNTLWSKIKTYISNNTVAKETGKGLSTNDFTAAYKSILDSIDSTVGDTSHLVKNSAVNRAISDLIDGAPKALDTLKKISNKLQANDDVATALAKQISDETVRAKVEEQVIKKSVVAESERAKIKEDNISQSLDEAKTLFDNKITAESEARSNKDRELQDTLEGITKTGEASAASNVTYNHNDSQLDATNVQQAIDEVYSKGNTNRENAKTELEKSISDNKTAVDASIQDVYKKSNYNDGDNVIDFNTIHLVEDNPEYIYALVDADGRLLIGYKKDTGTPIWGYGIPKQIKDYVDKQVNAILGTNDLTTTIDSLKEIEQFLHDFSNSDSLKKLLDNKVDKTYIESKVERYYKDSNPNDDEGNIVKTNEFLSISKNEEYLSFLIDNAERIILALDKKGLLKVFTDLSVRGTKYSLNDNSEYVYTLTDSNDKLLFGIKKADGDLDFGAGVPSQIKDYIEEKIKSIDLSSTNDKISSLNDKISSIQNIVDSVNPSSAVVRNSNRISALYAACRQTTSKKDFQLEIITDTHGNSKSIQHGIEFANSFSTVDAVIHCGDIAPSSGGIEKRQVSRDIGYLAKSEKPWFICIGNHDVGNTPFVTCGVTHEEAYTMYIKPMIDAGMLKDGEYQEGKCYYYHDFVSDKYNKNIRLIVPYEYDAPLDVADNDYWEIVDYNSSYPLMESKNYIYSTNSPVYVNCGCYKEHSFKLKASVTVKIAAYYHNDNLFYGQPYFKISRAEQFFRKEQTEWLIQTLLSTPDNYGIVIATHNPSSQHSTNQVQFNFANTKNMTSSREGQYGISTDLIADIVNAYNNRNLITEKVIGKDGGWIGIDNGTYLNTNDDGDGEKYYYKVSADFSNAKAKVLGFVCGHTHEDFIFKHDKYNQYTINTVGGIIDFYGDVMRTNVDNLAYDAITTTSWSDGRIGLARLGNIYNSSGKLRDLEIINTTK